MSQLQQIIQALGGAAPAAAQMPQAVSGGAQPQIQVSAPSPNFNISGQPVRSNTQGYSIAPEGLAQFGVPPSSSAAPIETSMGFLPGESGGIPTDPGAGAGVDPRMAILAQMMKGGQPSPVGLALAGIGDALRQSQAAFVPPYGPTATQMLLQNAQVQQQQKLQALLLAHKLGLFPGPSSDLDTQLKQALLEQRQARTQQIKEGKTGTKPAPQVTKVVATPELAQKFGFAEGTPLQVYTDRDGNPIQAYPAVAEEKQPNLHFVNNNDGTIDMIDPKTGELKATKKTSTKLGATASTRVIKNAADQQALINSYESIDKVMAHSKLSDTMKNLLRDSPKLLQLTDLMGAARTPEERAFVSKFQQLQANLRGTWTNEVGNLNEDEAERALAPLRTLNMDQLKSNLRERINSLARNQRVEYRSAQKVGAEKSIPKLHYLNRDGKRVVKDPDAESDADKGPGTMPTLMGSESLPEAQAGEADTPAERLRRKYLH